MTAPNPPGRQPVDTDLNSRLGEVIRRRRTMLGLSQEALGKRLGISCQQVQKYEVGKNQLSFPRLVEMANVLAISVGDLAEAAIASEAPPHDGLSDRQMLELMKRIATLTPNQRRGVQLLVNSLAGEV